MLIFTVDSLSQKQVWFSVIHLQSHAYPSSLPASCFPQPTELWSLNHVLNRLCQDWLGTRPTVLIKVPPFWFQQCLSPVLTIDRWLWRCIMYVCTDWCREKTPPWYHNKLASFSSGIPFHWLGPFLQAPFKFRQRGLWIVETFYSPEGGKGVRRLSKHCHIPERSRGVFELWRLLHSGMRQRCV